MPEANQPDPYLFWRALLAFLLLPGMVAFAIPLLWLAPAAPRYFNVMGLVPLTLGIVLLLWTVRDFYVAGRGTLAPWSPPRQLVVVGLYRFSRNPMYIAVVLVLLGWAMTFHSLLLTGYAVAIACGFHLRVVLGEEPWLAAAHGEEWRRYVNRVPRWVSLRR